MTTIFKTEAELMAFKQSPAHEEPIQGDADAQTDKIPGII